MTTSPIRCVGLLSGGLDSILATRLMVDLGLDVHCINLRSPFCTCTSHSMSCSAAELAMRQIGEGLPLAIQPVADEYLELVKHPRRGRGRGLNPCLDCRAFKFRMAWRHAQDIGARFLFTGEVLGQRPMSQHRRALAIIDRDAGLEGLVLRPLSAQLMDPTIPEREGWVDREALLALSGRTRKPQMAMAQELGIDQYPCPAGGCLLTDPGFARRLADLFEHHPECTVADVQPLKVGRHFRTDDGAKIVVGRNDIENRQLVALAPPGLLATLHDHPGPVVLVQDAPARRALDLALDASFCHASVAGTPALALRLLGACGSNEATDRRSPSANHATLRASMERWRL